MNGLIINKVLVAFSVMLFLPIASYASTHSLARYSTMLSLNSASENQMWEAGHWQYNGMSGFIQVVFTSHPYSPKGENIAQAMQLQWIRTDHSEKELIYKVSVNEFNHSPNFTFSTPQCNTPKSCMSFTILAHSSFEEHAVPFNLTIGGLGQYILTPLSRSLHASL